ncbi:MAG: hypothetical protein KTR24_00985 [Saprospiraceae bacterium]|nr:hypothetical protein [Saprospiraceae bacterium]
MSEYYGKGGRLTKSAHPSLINTAYQHDASHAAMLLPGLRIADLAHIITLTKAGAIESTEAKTVIDALLLLTAEKIEIRPELGDVYNSKEKALKDQIGDQAGWLHLSRARREAVNSSFLITLKPLAIEWHQALLSLASAFIDLAETHQESVMPDFTYLLHAQPTTLGHYLGTYISPLMRDLERFTSFYDRLDQSWGGIGSINGSSISLDRELLAALMGFAKPAAHTRDAMWMPDICNEAIGHLAGTLSGLMRFVEELIVWNTQEFGYIEMDDSFARSSVIMPQKKNPYPLTYFRGLATTLAGKVSTYFQLGSAPSGFPDSRTFIYGDLVNNFIQATGAINMLRQFLLSLRWRTEVMQASVSKGFSFAMDVAERVSIHFRMDYKSSHHLVGKAIRMCEADPARFTELLTTVLAEQGLTMDEHLRKFLGDVRDPSVVIALRKGVGTASVPSQQEYLNRTRGQWDQHQDLLHRQQNQHQTSTELLNQHLATYTDAEFQPIIPSGQTK